MARRKGKKGKGKGKGKKKNGNDAAVASSDSSGAVAEEETAPEGAGTAQEWKTEESEVLNVLKNRARGRMPWWGVVVFIYKLKYGGLDNQWYNGQTFLNTKDDKDNLTKGNHQEVSIWTYPQDGSHEVEHSASLLWDINHPAIMKPIFIAYNRKIEKVVAGFTRYNKKFDSWINSQQTVEPDGYLPSDGVSMISSVLGAISEALKENRKFDGLDNKSSYAMLGCRIRILPFNIRRGSDDKVADRTEQLLAFSELLLNEFHPKWQDPDLKEFITLMRKPHTTINQLLQHPLLSLPEKREFFYRKLWIHQASNEQNRMLFSKQDYNGWKQNIPAHENVLTYMLVSGSYADTFGGAFKYCHDTSSHYMHHSRNLSPGIFVTSYTVESKLKNALPGLISKVYAFSLHPVWSISLR